MISKYVDWFVNREKERRGFLKMIARETPKQIIFVEAPTDMGKTWLIERLRHECRARQVLVAHFDFSGRRPLDYLAIVRHVRDELGPAAFNSMTVLINNLTITVRVDAGPVTPGDVNIRIAEGGQIKDSSVSISEVASGHIIKDNYFDVHADSQAVRENSKVAIVDAFFGCLAELSRDRAVVFLFDSYEAAREQAREWVEDELLRRIRYERLPNVIVVLAGQEVPNVDRSAWEHVLAHTGLGLFSADDVREYLERRGQTGRLHLETIVLTSGRHPARLGEMVDSSLVDMAPDDESLW